MHAQLRKSNTALLNTNIHNAVSSSFAPWCYSSQAAINASSVL
jgi:hypothetical protein